MDSNERKLIETLAHFDGQREALDEMQIADAIQDLARKRGKNAELAPRELAEGMAFSFAVADSGELSKWGTYYGPMTSWRLKSGDMMDSPDIERIDQVMLTYWKQRLDETKHPQLRVRYADLIFDFTERVTGRKPDHRLAHAVVDETLKIIEKGYYKHTCDVHDKLARALDLAMRLNDKERVARVRESLILFEKRTAESDALGTWGIAYDLLIEGSRKCGLTDEQEGSILVDLEDRLKVASTCTPPNAFATESAALRLARYYHRKDRRDDLRRVLRVYADAWVQFSAKAMPLLGVTWLEKVYRVLLHFGLKEDANAIEVRLRDLGRHSDENMATISEEIRFTRDEIDQFVDSMTFETAQESLRQIAWQFLPDPNKTKREVLKMAEQFPLASIFSNQIMDSNGRIVAKVGSVEHDLDGRVVMSMSDNMGLWAPFLRIVLDRMCEKHDVTADMILNFLFESPVFENRRRQLIGSGIDAFLRGDSAVAVHMLIPQIEAAVRRIVEKTGGPILDRGRHGGMNLSNLDKLLRCEQLHAVLGEKIALYLRVLLTDQRGWNVRNKVCHGISDDSEFGVALADRVFHALLLLASVRDQGPKRASDVGRATQNP